VNILHQNEDDGVVDDEIKVSIGCLGSVGGKPRYEINVDAIINFNSKFREKDLCTGWTYSLGSGCHFNCKFCYVWSIVRQHTAVKMLLAELEKKNLKFEDVCVVRHAPLEKMRQQLLRRRSPDIHTPGVVFTSPLVDCAATKDFALQTAAADRIILELTSKDVRHLSKGASYCTIIDAIPERFHDRLIFGYSLGTIEGELASAIEGRTASPSRRLAELNALQDRGLRTYGMVCPVMPRADLKDYAKRVIHAHRVEHLEHIWVEPINVRGESMTNTRDALTVAGFNDLAARVEAVSANKDDWEEYARELFHAFAAVIPPEKYRFLQYATRATLPWWTAQRARGAVILGTGAETLSPFRS